MTKKSYDCRSCGACCGSPSWSDTIADYDFSTPADRRRAEALPDSTKRRVLVAPSPLAMFAEVLAGGQAGATISTGSKEDRHGNVVCAALRGAINNDPKSPSKCSCSIYEHRPRVCRIFPVGGYLCVAARNDSQVLSAREK